MTYGDGLIRAVEGATRSKTKLPTSEEIGRKVPFIGENSNQDPSSGTKVALFTKSPGPCQVQGPPPEWWFLATERQPRAGTALRSGSGFRCQ